VIDRAQPVPVSAPSVNVAVSPVEQLSATDAVPKAAAICAAVGLHATAVLAVTVITGASVSRVKVIVCVCVPVLPHASVTVHVLVIERAQPVPVSAPSVKVAVRPVEQLSVTEAVPKAAAICAFVGLQPGLVLAVKVITGLMLSIALNVWLHVVLQPVLFVVKRVRVYGPHAAPAITETFCPLVEPEIIAFPLIDQL